MIYPRRFVAEPRKRSAYCDACDMIAVYGVTSISKWATDNFDISDSEKVDIWRAAKADMLGKSPLCYCC